MLPKGRWRVRAEGAWETSGGRRSGEVEWVGREEEEEVTPKRRVARDGEPESEGEREPLMTLVCVVADYTLKD